MSCNKAYNNGINGLVVHKTNRARVAGNVLWDNGKVGKNPPESRQQQYRKWSFKSNVKLVRLLPKNGCVPMKLWYLSKLYDNDLSKNWEC